MDDWHITNQYGAWCTACGEFLSKDAEFIPGDECPTCGFPDDGEKMFEHFVGDPTP